MLTERERDQNESGTRRDFMKKAAYVVPAVMSVNVALVAARAGSNMDPEQLGRKGEAPSREGRDYTRDERRTDRDK